MITVLWYFLALSGAAVVAYSLIVAPVIPLSIAVVWWLLYKILDE